MPFSGTVLNSQVPFGIVPQAADVSFWADGLCTQPPGTPRTLPGGSDLAAWYNARDTASLEMDGSDRVSLWQDRSGLSDEPGLVLPGVLGNSATTPNAAPLQITGDIQIDAELTLPSYTLTTRQTIAAKYNSTADNRGYWFYVQGSATGTAGALVFQWSTDGTSGTLVTAESTVALPVAAFGKIYVRVTLDVDNGTSGNTVRFFLSIDGVTWTQLGADVVTASATSIFASTQALEIGLLQNSQFTTGIIQRVVIRNGIDGPIVFDADFTKQAKLTTSFTEDSTNAATVTVNQSGDLPARITGARDLYQGTVAKMPVRFPVSAELPLNGLSILNGDFEDVSGGGGGSNVFANTWRGSALTIEDETIDVYEGSHSVRLTGAGSIASTAVNQFRQGTNTNVGAPASWTAGRRYRVRFAAKNVSGGSLTFGNGFRTLLVVPAASAVDWTVFEWTGTLYNSLVINVPAFAAASGAVWLIDALEITALAAPTPYLYFDGSNNFLKAPPFALSQPTTVYFVGEQVTWTAGRLIYDGDAVQSMALRQITATPQIQLHAGTPAAINGDMPVAERKVVAAVYDGASSQLRVSLASNTSGNAGSASANSFTLGAGGNLLGPANIAVSEIVIFAAAHDTATQDRIIRALARQGSIAV